METEKPTEGSGRNGMFIWLPLVGLFMIVYFIINPYHHKSQALINEELAEAQAESLAISAKAWQQLSGRLPLSLVDQLPSGQKFVVFLPRGTCVQNAFTGLKTEPRFFDYLYEKASKGTIAIVKDGRKGYVVVYGREQTICFKIGL